MAFDWPFTSTPVSNLPRSIEVAECGRSPTLVKVTVVPCLMRMRAGAKLYSTLFAPALTASTPATIGPVGPATVCGGGGGHSEPSCPFNEKAHTASPYALPCSWLPPVAIATRSEEHTSELQSP